MCARYSSYWLSQAVFSSILQCVSGLIPSQGIWCWELPIPWWLMGRALQSLHMVICVMLKMGPFQLFTAFFAILFTDRYNHYLKISKLSSKLSFQLRLSRDSGIAEQLMLTGPCFPATHRVLSNAPLHLAFIQKQGAENTLICASILCHGRIS